MTCQVCQGKPMSEIRREHNSFIFSSDAKCQAFLFNLFYCNLATIVSLTGEIRSSHWMSLNDLTVALTFILHQNPARDGVFACSWQECRLYNVLITGHTPSFWNSPCYITEVMKELQDPSFRSAIDQDPCNDINRHRRFLWIKYAEFVLVQIRNLIRISFAYPYFAQLVVSHGLEKSLSRFCKGSKQPVWDRSSLASSN